MSSFRTALLAAQICAALVVAACTAAPSPTSTTATDTMAPTAAPAAPGATAVPAATAVPDGTALPAAPTPAPTAPPKPAVESMVVSFSNVVPDNLPLWVTREAGLFDQHALKVDLRFIASSTGIPALLAGETTVFTGGGSETLSATANGADLVLLGNFVPVYPFLFEVPADITTLDQLRGKRVGVSSIGSSSDIASRAGLRRAGLDPDHDVTFVPLGSSQNLVAGLLNGAVQGIVSRPPDSVGLEAKGFHPLFDLAEQKLPAVNTCIVVQRAYLESHRDVVQRYIDAIVEGLTRMRQDRAFSVEVLKKYFQSDDQHAMEVAYDYHVARVYPLVPTLSATQFEDAIAQLSKNEPRVRDVDLTRLIDNSFVQSAVARGLAGPNVR
jgi:ABC-type nitrate/sulfonate/bicarbonate transport system substrate-binding protein